MKNLSSVVVLLFLFAWTAAAAADKIDVNTAPLEDLVKIIHIGEVRAKELISLRPFSSLDDLARIKGIGQAKVEDIKNEGLAWVGHEEKLAEIKPQLEKPEPVTYPPGIVINEILPSPEGPDETKEWIEIFNQNNFEVNLAGWQITDTEGATKTYTFPRETQIGPEGFLVLSRPTSKITLNNSGDGLNLIQPDGKMTDKVNYEKALRGQSYNRVGSKWTWSNALTPGSTNTIPAPIKEIEPSREGIKAPVSEEEVEEVLPKRGLAALGEQIPKETASFPPFLAALFVAIFSGTIILTLKKRVKNLDLLEK